MRRRGIARGILFSAAMTVVAGCLRVVEADVAPARDGGVEAGPSRDAGASRPNDASPIFSDATVSVDGGHRYEAVCDSPLDWASAKAAAEKRGGHLATVTSQAEHEAVLKLIDRDAQPDCWNAPEGAWLGAVRDNTNAPWRWVTGEPWASTWWQKGEPNGAGDVENNAVLASDGAWYDSNGKRLNGYIIEWD